MWIIAVIAGAIIYGIIMATVIDFSEVYQHLHKKYRGLSDNALWIMAIAWAFWWPVLSLIELGKLLYAIIWGIKSGMVDLWRFFRPDPPEDLPKAVIHKGSDKA